MIPIARAVRIGSRFEQHVDRGPREPDPFVHESAKEPRSTSR
jgi:hypothetical protein